MDLKGFNTKKDILSSIWSFCLLTLVLLQVRFTIHLVNCAVLGFSNKLKIWGIFFNQLQFIKCFMTDINVPNWFMCDYIFERGTPGLEFTLLAQQ